MNLNIRNKLFAGFGAVVALAIVLGVFSISKLGSTNESTKYIQENTVASIDQLAYVRAIVRDYRIGQMQHVIAATPGEMDAAEEAMAAAKKKVDDRLAGYEKLLSDAEDEKRYKDVQSKWTQYQERTKAFLPLSRDLKTEQATAVLSGENQKLFADGLVAGLISWSDYNGALGKKRYDEAQAAYGSARTFAIILLLLAAGIGAAVAYFLSRGISSGINQMVKAADGIAKGDVDQNVDVKSKDEIGAMGQAFGRMIDYLKGIGAAAERVGDGDLTVDVEPHSDRDLLGNAFKKMIANLRDIVGSVGSATGQVASASQQMASTSEEAGKAVGEIASAVGDVAQGAERQVRGIESVKQSADEAASAAATSAQQAREASEVADQAREVAQEGVAAAEQATAAMETVSGSSESVTQAIRDLASKSDEIGAIVETITGIAGQTNLLALNAAIEAARAGEQGRGFAVVAEEVRKLAEESQKAAEEIAGLIQQIQGETQNVVGVVEGSAEQTQQGAETVAQTREAFMRIGAAVEDVTSRIGQIAGAAEQISAETSKMQGEIADVAAVAEQSSASTEEVSASTEQTSASTQEIAASAQELASTAEGLEQLVGRFKVNA